MPTKTTQGVKLNRGTKRATVAILAGGMSSERDVSLKTGHAVHKALLRSGHTVHLIDLTANSIKQLDGLACDVVFLALHGTFGEDGQIQKLLDARGIQYTGSGAKASQNAMDKLASKILFLKNGVPTAPYHEATPNDSVTDINRIQRRLGLPVVVKPRAEGSSLGVSKVMTTDKLVPALDLAFKYGNRAIVERFIPGREVVVSILDGKPLSVIEVQSAEPFFNYKAKYEDSKTRYILDPTFSSEKLEEIQQTALAAHRALGCRHYSRVDIICCPNEKNYVLEVNTLPGLTERSLLPKAAQASGVSFPKLCQTLLNLAMDHDAA